MSSLNFILKSFSVIFEYFVQAKQKKNPTDLIWSALNFSVAFTHFYNEFGWYFVFICGVRMMPGLVVTLPSTVYALLNGSWWGKNQRWKISSCENRLLTGCIK